MSPPTAGPKIKVSLTLAPDLVATIDRGARRQGLTRSAMAERWLGYGASRAAEVAIEDATAAYYASITPEARDEDEAIARASSRAARKIRYDAPLRKPTRRSR